MAIQKRDTWEKPRSQGVKLTRDEIQQIRTAYNTGRSYFDIARELQCSSRITSKYYAVFRGSPQAVSRKKEIEQENACKPPVQKARFYTSNFEL